LSILVALTVGLVFWITAWAFGIKAFDAFMVTVLLVVLAAAARAISPFVKKMMGREAAPSTERGAGF
jgi:Mn2+/Fe2+ NRAMP family transporter